MVKKRFILKLRIIPIFLGIIIFSVFILGEFARAKKSAIRHAREEAPIIVDYPEITSENYPGITFLDTPVIIDQADYAHEGWITAIPEDISFEIEHPIDRRVNYNPIYGTSFCQPQTCQDGYPVIEVIKDKSIEQIFAEMVDCDIVRCYGMNVAVADFELGDYKGSIWWMDRLTQEEAFNKIDNKLNDLPDTKSAGLLVLKYDGSVYLLRFDLSNYVQRKMLSTFRLPSTTLRSIKNELDEIKVFIQDYVDSLVSGDQARFVSLLTANTSTQVNLTSVPFGKIISHDLLDITGPNSDDSYIVRVRIWSEGGFPILQEGNQTQLIDVVKENETWKTTTWEYSLQN